MSSTEINGRWKRLAVYEHENCKNIMHGGAYEESGIKTLDGSVFALDFEGHQVWAYDENTKDKEMTDQVYGRYS